VDEAVAVCGVLERRSDAKLPAHVVAYLTLGLSLFPDDDYEEVAAKVTGSLDRFGCWNAGWLVPTVSAITQGRKRLGRGVFPELFERTCGPVAGDAGPHAALTALGTARGSVPAGLAAAGHRRVRAGPAGHPGQRGRVRVRRVRGQPVGLLQGQGGRVGRVRHPRVPGRRGRRLSEQFGNRPDGR